MVLRTYRRKLLNAASVASLSKNGRLAFVRDVIYRKTMDKKSAEVLYWISEHASETGHWFDLCNFLHEKGITPKQIADAVNKAAESAGYSSGLTAADCQ